MAMLGDGSHRDPDRGHRNHEATGEDMMAKYKETSKGGLAVNVVECRLTCPVFTSMMTELTYTVQRIVMKDYRRFS